MYKSDVTMYKYKRKRDEGKKEKKQDKKNGNW